MSVSGDVKSDKVTPNPKRRRRDSVAVSVSSGGVVGTFAHMFVCDCVCAEVQTRVFQPRQRELSSGEHHTNHFLLFDVSSHMLFTCDPCSCSSSWRMCVVL